MYFSGKNKVKFGLPIFKKNLKESQKRVILEYDSKTSTSIKYNEPSRKIIFNNLIPPTKELEGMEEYYIPDGSFNAYEYRNNKWWYKEDIDARNDTKIKTINKKPQRGLIPR